MNNPVVGLAFGAKESALMNNICEFDGNQI